MLKKAIPILVLVLIIAIVGTSGCTSSTKEVLVGEYKATNNAQGNPLIVTLPNGTDGVRVEYTLKAPNTYGIGGNGNIGVTDDTIQQGEDPWMNGQISDSKYLEGKGQTLTGNLTFDSGKYLAYQGMFTGNLKVYANVTT